MEQADNYDGKLDHDWTFRVKCPAQEHNAMTPARARARSARSRVQRANRASMIMVARYICIHLVCSLQMSEMLC